MIRTKLALALLFVAGAGPVLAQDTLRVGSPAQAGFDAARLRFTVEWVRGLVDSGTVPGAQILIARNGVVVAHQSFGVIDAESRRPMDDRSLLWLASIVKPITATAVMQLADEGKLGLDDRVERYLPHYAQLGLRTEDGVRRRPITIRQLLAHTSGLGESPTRHSTLGKGWMDQTIAFAVDSIAADSLRFEPGTDWNYANAGYVTLGRIVEVVSGVPFNRFVRERILNPLGMRNSVWATEFTPALEPRLAKVYSERRGTLEAYFAYDPTFPYRNEAPNGGLFGTTMDVARFAQAFLNGGTYGGQRILAPATARLMMTEQTPSLDTRYGLGWATQWPISRAVGAWRGKCVFGHTGSAGTHVWVDRDLGLMGLLFLQWADDRGTLDSLRDRFQHLVYASLTPEALRSAATPGACG